MPTPAAIRVEGLAGFQKALRELEPRLNGELRKALTDAAEPIRQTASGLAVQKIPRITSAWAQFRIGSSPGLIYLAPKQRGTRIPGRKRPKFAALLATRAMEPALSANERQVETRVGQAMEDVLRKAGL